MICNVCGKEIDDDSKPCKWCEQSRPINIKAMEMYCRGQILIQQGRVEDALSSLAGAVEADPRCVDAWLLQASLLQRQERWEESLKYLDRAVKINPGSAELWFFVGNALDALSPNPPSTRGSESWNRIAGALHCFEKSLEINPGFCAVWFGKAQSQEKLGRHQDALRSYEKFLSLNPGPEMELQRSHARERLLTREILVIPPASEGPEEKAKTWIERMAEGGPEDFLAFFDMTLQLNPDDPKGWISKGYGLENIGRDDEALAHYEKAIELDPVNDDAWTRKGTLLAKLTRFEDALQCFQKAIDSNPNAALPCYRKGLLEQKLGRSKEAVHSFGRFLKLVSPDSTAHDVEDAKRRTAQLLT